MTKNTTVVVPGEDDAIKLTLFDLFETDTKAENEGRWFHNIGAQNSGISVKMRRIGAKPVELYISRLQQANAGLMRGGQFSPDTQEMFLTRALSDVILLDWKNVRDRDGAEIPFTKDAAKKLIDQLPAFRNMLLNYATNTALWKVETTEAVEGN